MERTGRTKRQVHLLWTGGWDSTFRLLQLLFEYRVPVRTHYILDSRRRALGLELRTMAEIRQALYRDHPSLRRLWGPTQYFEKDLIRPDPRLEGAYRSVRDHYPCVQVEWLARWSLQEGIPHPELCVTSGGETGPLLTPHVKECRREGYTVYRVSPKARGGIPEIFRPFDLPLILQYKTDSLDPARRKGWIPYLERTCFCHHPTRRGGPCGICNTCKYAQEMGFAWRVPAHRRWLGRIVRPLRSALRALRRKDK
jgi:hypothetical protein